ncbi:MAG: hypothetical protein ABI542_13080 [Gemmatimonadota bacterium]
MHPLHEGMLAAQERDIRTMHRDTLTVESREAPLWGDPRIAQSTLSLHGPVGQDPFGSIDCFAALPGGGVAVLDRRGGEEARLLVLDANGTLERQLGRPGSGPGEFGRPSGNCLAADRDGTIFMLDGSNSRINRWTRAGDPLPAIVLGFTSGGPAPYIVVGDDGSIFVRKMFRPARPDCLTDASPFGFIRFDASGNPSDTVRLATEHLAHCPSHVNDPTDLLLPTNWGSILHSRSDRLGFVAINGLARHPRVLEVNRDVTPVALSKVERRQLEGLGRWTARVSEGRIPARDIARFRPIIHALYADPSPRIWVVMGGDPIAIDPAPYPRTERKGIDPPIRSVIEQLRLGAFMSDGRWLGEIVLPVSVDASEVSLSFGRTDLWTSHLDAEGIPTLTRWVLGGS